MSPTEEELANELFESRNLPDEWSDEPAEVEVKPQTTQILSFRLSLDELEGVQAAARDLDESVSEFIRGALALRVHGVPVGPTVEITSGIGSLTIRSRLLPRSTSENGAVDVVSDFPPTMVALSSE
jgi:hypothetical protein